MHTCSPASMRKERSSSAVRSPRITVTWFSASSGGVFGSRDVGPALSRMATHAHSIRAAGLLAFSNVWLKAIRQENNKKEVKTRRFSPPGVVGCCRQSLSDKAGLPCQAGLMPHSRDACRNAVRDLPPEGVSWRFVAPQSAHVNGKISLGISLFLKVWSLKSCRLERDLGSALTQSRHDSIAARESLRCGLSRHGSIPASEFW